MISQGSWLLCFKYILRIIEGRTKFLADLEQERDDHIQEQLSQFICNSSIEYFELHQQSIQGKEEKQISSMISVVTELLLRSNQSQFLFSEIYSRVIELGYEELFYAQLAPFIQTRKLKKIPQAILMKIIKHYSSQSRTDIISFLILNLDLQNQNNSELIQFCLENRLFKALVYACNIGNNDFIMPIISFLMQFNELKDRDVVGAEKFGQRLLWYLRLCLKGQLITGDQINDNAYETIIYEIIKQLFVQENLKSIINIDYCSAFQIFTILFESKPNQFIEKNINKWQIAFNEQEQEYIDRLVQGKDQQFEYNLELNKLKDIHHQIIAKVYYYRENCLTSDWLENQNQLWFHVFISRLVLLNRYFVKFQFIVEAVLYFLKTPTHLKYIFIQYTEKQQQSSALINLDNEEQVIAEGGTVLIKLLKRINKELLVVRDKAAENAVQQLLNEAELSPITEVAVYLQANIQKDYRRALEIYLQTKNYLLQDKLFDWIVDLTEQFQKEDNYQHPKSTYNQWKEYIFEFLNFLISLDMQRTHEIICKFDQQTQENIMQMIKPFPTLQLRYLQNIMKSNQELSNEQKILHVELLCKLNDEKQLLKVLSKEDYPQLQCLETCKKYKMKYAQALLYVRKGGVQQAIKIYIKKIKKQIQRYKLRLEKGQHIQGVNLHLKVDKLLNILKSQENDQSWFVLLDEFNEIYTKEVLPMKTNSTYFAIFNFFQEEFKQAFLLAGQMSSIETFKSSIEIREGFLKWIFLKSVFKEIFFNYSHGQTILTTQKSAVIDTVLNSTDAIQDRLQKGYFGNNNCQICQDNTVQGNSIIFLCGHIFHQTCIKYNYCPICANNYNSNVLIFIASEISMNERLSGLQNLYYKKIENAIQPAPEPKIEPEIEVKQNQEEKLKEFKKQRRRRLFRFRMFEQQQNQTYQIENYFMEKSLEQQQ